MVGSNRCRVVVSTPTSVIENHSSLEEPSMCLPKIEQETAATRESTNGLLSMFSNQLNTRASTTNRNPVNPSVTLSGDDNASSETPVHQLELEHAFRRLVQRSGAQSTATIFTTVSSCWESLRCLEDVCPTWASYTGATSISNRFFHRSELCSGASLLQLFSYYALLDETHSIIVFPDRRREAGQRRRERILDALVLLDGMRISLNASVQTRAPVARHGSVTRVKEESSRCSTISECSFGMTEATRDSCLLSRILSGNADGACEGNNSYNNNHRNNNNRNNYSINTNSESVCSLFGQSNATYIPMSRCELEGVIVEIEPCLFHNLSTACLINREEEKKDFNISQLQHPPSASTLADRHTGLAVQQERLSEEVVHDILTVTPAGDASSHSDDISSFSTSLAHSENSASPAVEQLVSCGVKDTSDGTTESSSYEGVNELVEFLDRIREVLDVPSIKLETEPPPPPQDDEESSGSSSAGSSSAGSFSAGSFSAGSFSTGRFLAGSSSSGVPTAVESDLVPDSTNMVLRLLSSPTAVIDQMAKKASTEKEMLAWMALALCLEDAKMLTDCTASSRKMRRRSTHSLFGSQSLDSSDGRRGASSSSSSSSSGSMTKRRKITTSGSAPSNSHCSDGSSAVSESSPDPFQSAYYPGADLTTPCPGVCWDPTHMRWVAHWSDAKTHQRIRKYFNPKLLGFGKARLFAILTRKEAVDSGRASMMVKSDRPKVAISTYVKRNDDKSDPAAAPDSPVIPTDDPFDPNYVKGVYYNQGDHCWYSHVKHEDSSDIKVEAFPVAEFLQATKGSENAAMGLARAKAFESRQAAGSPSTEKATPYTTCLVLPKSPPSSSSFLPSLSSSSVCPQQRSSDATPMPLNGIVVPGRLQALSNHSSSGPSSSFVLTEPLRSIATSCTVRSVRFPVLPTFQGASVGQHSFGALHPTASAGHAVVTVPVLSSSSKQPQPHSQNQQLSPKRTENRGIMGPSLIGTILPPTIAHPTITASPKPFVDHLDLVTATGSSTTVTPQPPPPRNEEKQQSLKSVAL